MNADDREEIIPPSLKIALDVREEDYQRARRQNGLLWLGTMAGMLAATLLWFTGVLRVDLIPLFPWLAQGVLGGLGAHAVLRVVFTEAPRVNTMKFRKYKELRQWRAAQRKNAGRAHESTD